MFGRNPCFLYNPEVPNDKTINIIPIPQLNDTMSQWEYVGESDCRKYISSRQTATGKAQRGMT